ncbi:histidine phosphatase family protein [Glaciecola sp. XM2]|jgi:broad specificity phosphatase PhoE|uniref:phosphoglycerate mutase family protein n=1 Tax=Glaciecola sp. XM2 TaxID=1914931 RepID=UPI001BDE91BB|nr:phosphoglycerate mutase family protein [Glaciecola sp. XM2]MBT1449317.1 histidine phosphatase family protein [Glaciecola sp. XM2]
MKLLSVLLYVLVGWIMFSSFNLAAQTNQTDSDIYTIYMLRHAEKATDTADKRNPPLSECGLQRAQSLSTMFQAVDIDTIYSTDYLRTQMTAKPVSQDKGLKVVSYNPRELASFAKQLIQNKQNTLVVGHSNTTNVLAGYLTGKALAQIDETIYDRVYQVTLVDGTKPKAKLQLLHQTFSCYQPL